MGINQIEILNQKRFNKRKEVEIFLNNLNGMTQNRTLHFDIGNIKLELNGLLEKFKRESINISILSEVSSGKSTFLNALVFGEPILESTIGETTAKIFNIKYDKKFSINGVEKESLLEIKEQIDLENHKILENITQNRDTPPLQSTITLPNRHLKKGIELYDTPGFSTMNENYIIPLLRETISKSDATILLLDISQGIKKSEYNFIKDMLPRIQINKRFIVLNKYDTLINEDNLILKSKEQIESEISNLIDNIESKLQQIQGESTQKIETYHLSAKKALVSKMQKDPVKFSESRFGIFEKDFWNRVVNAKDEVFEDNVNTFEAVKKELKVSLLEEREVLLKNRKSLQFQLRESLNSRDKIMTIEKNLATIKRLNSDELKQKSQNRLVELEHQLVEETLSILKVNLASELSAIPLSNTLLFWKLKEKYQKTIVSVIEDARSFIIKHINLFITEATKNERVKESAILEINRDLNILFPLEKYEKRVNLEATLDRVVKRTKGYVPWSLLTLISLLKYKLSGKTQSNLEPSFIELTSEIATIKRDLNTIISNSQTEIEEYIVFVNEKVSEIKKSLTNQESLEREIEEISDFVEEISNFTDDTSQ